MKWVLLEMQQAFANLLDPVDQLDRGFLRSAAIWSRRDATHPLLKSLQWLALIALGYPSQVSASSIVRFEERSALSVLLPVILYYRLCCPVKTHMSYLTMLARRETAISYPSHCECGHYGDLTKLRDPCALFFEAKSSRRR
jgi:hypothetical protein